ncbi:ATP-dependent RNA helicase DHX30-like [Pollicipes pollicipes]|uniref:ATP-dependent RNA helicase DHX30-like n=1 Tax=Pollicipes pollicipes TaxID=41117 RepID=UPI0018857278|nr:ATP-dependent RNA helicase DHX30-like [Pollicipes pollicipes]
MMLSLGPMRNTFARNSLLLSHLHKSYGILNHIAPCQAGRSIGQRQVTASIGGFSSRRSSPSLGWTRCTSQGMLKVLCTAGRCVSEYRTGKQDFVQSAATHSKDASEPAAQHARPAASRLPRRFLDTDSLFAHVVNVTSAEFPHVPRPRASSHRTRADEWECRLTAHWPETAQFFGRARSKRAAISVARADMLKHLQARNLISPSGDPVLYSRDELGARAAALRQPPPLDVDARLLPEVTRLYGRFKEVREAVLRQEEEPAQQADQSEAMHADACEAFFGGPERAWPAARREERSERLEQRLRRRRQLAAEPDSAAADCERRQEGLPIRAWRDEIISAVDRHRVLVIKGETGSGKSTQVPQMLLDAWTERGCGADCNIVVSQPRRLAAVSLARRVAELRGEQLREAVGYQVRLDSCLPQQRGGVLFCTMGILLARLQRNSDLSGISHLIIDEVHERSVETDVLLLLVRRLLERDRRLRVVLMSASVDTALFSQYFGGAPVLDVPGRLFPVKQHFLEGLGERLGVGAADLAALRRRDEQERPQLAAEPVAQLVAAVCRRRPPGAVLVFLEGMAEIKQVEERLRQLLSDPCSHWVLPVSGRLNASQQHAIFDRPPPGVRKVVLATNVAETGITVDDVVYVVDTGAVKQARLDAETGTSCLRTEWISQASAAQRQGRAGRVQPGEIYRLYSRRRLAQMDDYDTPELLRAPLETVVLDAKHLSADTPAEEFLASAIEPPSAAAVRAALAELTALQMLDDDEQLTALGRLAARFELHPRQVRLLVYGVMFRCLEPALTLVGWEMSGREPYNVALERRQELLRVKRQYSHLSDQEVAVKLFQGFLRDPSDKHFCEQNMVFRNGMHTVKSLVRMVRSQLQQTGLVGRHASFEPRLASSEHELNALAERWPVVTAALIAGHVKNVSRIQRGAVVKGRVRPNVISIRCSRGAADTVGDSVNRQPGGALPFLAYGNAFFSTHRRRRVLRDTSQASALQVALCYGDRSKALPVDEETGQQTLRLSCGGEFPLHVTAAPSAVRCVQQLRHVLHFTVWQQLEALDVPGPTPHLEDVVEVHDDAVRLLARLLETDSVPR